MIGGQWEVGNQRLLDKLLIMEHKTWVGVVTEKGGLGVSEQLTFTWRLIGKSQYEMSGCPEKSFHGAVLATL